MSFASEIKHELCALPLDLAQQKMQLCAFFLLKGSIVKRRGIPTLQFKTAHAFIAKHVYMLIKSLYAIAPEIAVSKSNLKKKKTYALYIEEKDFEKLSDLEIFAGGKLKEKLAQKKIRSEKMLKALLQGAFLAAGSINSPKSTNYHLEIAAPNEKCAAFFEQAFNRLHLPVKSVQRRKEIVLYLKASEKIADFLSFIEASNALFQYEDIRIQRDFYNQFTRLDNCEVANEMKSQKAAREQLAWIEAIEARNETKIPEKIEHVITVRKENPEASTMELCNAIYLKYGEIISKSGMKHRLYRLRELAHEEDN